MNKDIGSFIKKQRKKKGLTQKELASLLHISDKAVSKWEVGDSFPDISLLFPLSEIFEISVDNLLKGTLPQKEKNVYKNFVYFNISMNIVVALLIMIYVTILLFNNTQGSSLFITIIDITQFTFITLLILLGITISSSIINLLYIVKTKGK
jgi:transcriptional regulator with XRE-family HTH domain